MNSAQETVARTTRFFRGTLVARHTTCLTQCSRSRRRRGLTIAQLSIGWALSQDGVTAALVGARRAEQVKDIARAKPLSREILDAIDAIVETERLYLTSSNAENSSPPNSSSPPKSPPPPKSSSTSPAFLHSGFVLGPSPASSSSVSISANITGYAAGSLHLAFVKPRSDGDRQDHNHQQQDPRDEEQHRDTWSGRIRNSRQTCPTFRR